MGEREPGNILKWDARFIELAHLISTWSKDQSTKVGCVIVNPDRLVIATGYNGLPRGMSDNPELFPERHDREKKKYQYYEHAERNAIYQAARLGHPVLGCTAYVTMLPCADCARGLIQAGMIRVVFDQDKTEAYKGKLDLSTPLDILKASYSGCVEITALRLYREHLS